MCLMEISFFLLSVGRALMFGQKGWAPREEIYCKGERITVKRMGEENRSMEKGSKMMGGYGMRKKLLTNCSSLFKTNQQSQTF